MRNWQVWHKIMPKIIRNEEFITIENIRDFRHSRQSVESAYISKTIHLSKIEGMDLISIPFWFRNSLSHIMVSFRFTDSEPLCLSIEARRSQWEEYSAIKWLVPHFWLIYIWWTELDLIGLRALQRQDPVYLYQLDLSLKQVRHIFEKLIQRTENLYTRPENYNTVLDNCTTNIWNLLKKYDSRLWFFHYSPWISGYFDRYLLDKWLIFPGENLSWEQARKLGFINRHLGNDATQIDSALQFSKIIRWW